MRLNEYIALLEGISYEDDCLNNSEFIKLLKQERHSLIRRTRRFG